MMSENDGIVKGKRLGKFLVSIDFLKESPRIIKRIERYISIIKVEDVEHKRVKEYTGESDLFDMVDSENIPFYKLLLEKTRIENGEIITIRAKRVREDGQWL